MTASKNTNFTQFENDLKAQNAADYTGKLLSDPKVSTYTNKAGQSGVRVAYFVYTVNGQLAGKANWFVRFFANTDENDNKVKAYTSLKKGDRVWFIAFNDKSGNSYRLKNMKKTAKQFSAKKTAKQSTADQNTPKQTVASVKDTSKAPVDLSHVPF